MDRWLQTEALKRKSSIDNKTHPAFHSPYRNQRFTAFQFQVCLLVVKHTVHKPSKRCKKCLKRAKRRNPTDAFLSMGFTQDVDDTSPCVLHVLCKTFLQYRSGNFQVKKSFWNKIQRMKFNPLSYVFLNLVFTTSHQRRPIFIQNSNLKMQMQIPSMKISFRLAPEVGAKKVGKNF